MCFGTAVGVLSVAVVNVLTRRELLRLGLASAVALPLAWMDTVYLPPSVPVQLIMRFADYADPAAPYMYHCHLLLHEDTGVMGQFVVVEPGQHPASLGSHGHDH